MTKYRYGHVENMLGSSWYLCQKKKFGIWWDDESFGSKDGLLRYVEQLKRNPNNILFNMNL